MRCENCNKRIVGPGTECSECEVIRKVAEADVKHVAGLHADIARLTRERDEAREGLRMCRADLDLRTKERDRAWHDIDTVKARATSAERERDEANRMLARYGRGEE